MIQNTQNEHYTITTECCINIFSPSNVNSTYVKDKTLSLEHVNANGKYEHFVHDVSVTQIHFFSFISLFFF